MNDRDSTTMTEPDTDSILRVQNLTKLPITAPQTEIGGACTLATFNYLIILIMYNKAL